MIYSPIEAHLKAIKASQTTANDPWTVIKKSAGKALQGGMAGAGAMVVQVSTLMWMRTVMNYQYRHGTTTMHAIRTLYAQGGGGLHGVLRFYKGFLPALLQGPLSRFGDTAANAGMLALLDSYPSTKSLSVEVKTVAASGAAALFRMFLMPIDCLKTTLQVAIPYLYDPAPGEIRIMLSWDQCVIAALIFIQTLCRWRVKMESPC